MPLSFSSLLEDIVCEVFRIQCSKLGKIRSENSSLCDYDTIDIKLRVDKYFLSMEDGNEFILEQQK